METMTSRWRMATAASAVALLAGLAVGTAPWAMGQGQDEYPACEDINFDSEDKGETVVCRDDDTLTEWAWVEVDDEEGEFAWQRVRDVVITTTTETQDPQTSTTTETATQTEEVTGVTTRTEFVPGETTVRRTTVVPRTSEPVAPQTRRQDAPPPADDVEESTTTTTTTMVLPEETSTPSSTLSSSPAATETSTPPNLSASDLVGANVPEESSSGPSWLMVLLVLGAIGSLGGGLWYLLRDEPDDLYK